MNKTYMTPSIKWLSVDADAAFLEASQIEINHEPVTPEESDAKEAPAFSSHSSIWDD